MPDRKKSVGRWCLRLFLWAAFLLIVGLIGCGVLYRYLGVYEETRPESFMDALMETMSAEDFLAQMEIDTGLPVTEFEDAAELCRQYLDGVDLQAPLSYQSLSRLGEVNRAEYAIRAGSSRLCVVTLASDDADRGFGMHGWRLERIHSGDFTRFLQSADLQINAYAQQPLLLNGTPVGQDFLADAAAPADVSTLESCFQPPTAFANYRIKPLYGDLSLTEADGSVIPLTEEADLHFTANAAEPGKHDILILAPADLTVTVGGVVLDPAEAERGAEILDGLESIVGAKYYNLTYTVSDIYGNPEISAHDISGAEHEMFSPSANKYGFLYRDDPALTAVLQPVAEDFFQSFVTYTSSAFNETRYTRLLQQIQKGTALYNYIAQSKDAMIWAPHSETAFAELTFEHFHMLNSRCFVCTVRYNADVSFSAKNEDYNYDMESAYNLAFQLTDQGWVAVAMSAAEDWNL